MNWREKKKPHTHTHQRNRSEEDAEEENERQFKEVCRPRLAKPVHFQSRRKFLSPQNYVPFKQALRYGFCTANQ